MGSIRVPKAPTGVGPVELKADRRQLSGHEAAALQRLSETNEPLMLQSVSTSDWKQEELIIHHLMKTSAAPTHPSFYPKYLQRRLFSEHIKNTVTIQTFAQNTKDK